MKDTCVEKQSLSRLPRLSGQSPSTASARWQAIVTRDSTAQSFVYGVRTTRIYCRPSCPARLARRANVEFYDSPTQAEAAGYRPCKRCRPQLHVRVDPHVLSVQKACETISSTCDSGDKLTLCELAAEAKLSPSHFHRVFKKIVGVTPGQYAMKVQKGYTPAAKGRSRADMMRNDHGRQPEKDEGISLVQYGLPEIVSHETDMAFDSEIESNMFDLDLIMSAEDSGLGWDFLDSQNLSPSVIDIPETIQRIVGADSSDSNYSAAESASPSGDAVSAVGPRQELDIFEFLEDWMYQT
ncbi:DNA repair and transcription factor Ada, putative [Paecilomyces variotii No. 5]|uniref:DNA repair and transcription factor Ada, putative n=1 Tax=Byssochlamys spectabilis (strain No. 5 / NBRC 109023) TaxID=1356009 RepID=V5G2D6_BYSSN|nr:DNA repair and transcription factor Ada, putative [Paecilomyces variotii No. 5]